MAASPNEGAALQIPLVMARPTSDVPLSGSGLMGAESILKALVPKAAAGVYSQLARERIRTAGDLAILDKGDLRDLGLTMVERCRVLRWARQTSTESHFCASPDTSPGTPGYSFGAELCDTMVPSPNPCLLDRGGSDVTMDEEGGRLDEIEQQADFWCSLVVSTTVLTPGMRDVRENVLEELFDVTPERVAEVYRDMRLQSLDENGCISESELGQGLRRCGLVGLQHDALRQILQTVKAQRNSTGLKLAEFEAILSRLKLAQILGPRNPTNADFLATTNHMKDLEGYLELPVTPPMRSESTVASYLQPILTTVDYNANNHEELPITESRLREFCFGHRHAAPKMAPLVRWVHLRECQLSTLLALTVKYGLHPLGVEDVIEQCPTKMDRYGCHYFAAVEQLCLVGDADGTAPVRVAGRHVAVFCSGPPLLDTVITVTQEDRSFADDWPDAARSEFDPWVAKLRRRLAAPRSRLRERRADFLMYHVIDLCTDQLVEVTRAFTVRLARLEAQVRKTEGDYFSAAIHPTSDIFREVSVARTQLLIVVRRLRGLQRLHRDLVGDSDLNASLSRYLQDIADHLDEAHEDATLLVEKTTAIIEAHKQMVERCKEAKKQYTAERLNKLLFILTVGTFLFAPVQFLSGVYGMNFVNKDGTPSIPDLRDPNGYKDFWRLTAAYFLVSVLLALLLFRCIYGSLCSSARRDAIEERQNFDDIV